MVKVFLDIGNTRIKWATVIDGHYEYMEGQPVESLLHSGDVTQFIEVESPDAVYITSVANPDVLEVFKNEIQSRFQLIPIILTSQKQCCGLTTGYDDFHKLGDDRWMAMQGAFAHYREPVIVIDAGTAMTIDAVIDGKHLGGFIVPGLTSLRASLAADTADLFMVDAIDAKQTLTDNTVDTLLGTNTASAILGGTLYMTASFINSIIADLNQQVGTVFKVVITGGNATELCPLIDVEYDYIPDLVLLGMVNIEESVKK